MNTIEMNTNLNKDVNVFEEETLASVIGTMLGGVLMEASVEALTENKKETENGFMSKIKNIFNSKKNK